MLEKSLYVFRHSVVGSISLESFGTRDHRTEAELFIFQFTV